MFIHRALREYLLLGYTMMSGPDLKAKVEEMSPVKRHSGISHFQEQYEVWQIGRGRERGLHGDVHVLHCLYFFQ